MEYRQRTISRQLSSCLVFLGLSGGLTQCASLEPYALPLSIMISDLADSLNELEFCQEKSEFFDDWLKDNQKKLAKQKASFDESCPIGSPECMSYQILASASIEVALRECLDMNEVKTDIERLNQLAGTSIKSNDAMR